MISNNRLLVYFYPKTQDGSFTYVARNHIEQLRRNGYQIFELDENIIDNIFWATKNNVALHPYLYFLVGHNYITYAHKRHRIDKIRKNSNKLIAFDVADTDRISDVAADTFNKADAIFVPSTFSKDVLINSGVESDVYVLPHGINQKFLEIEDTSNSEVYRKLSNIKERRNYKFVLFFLQHSGYRKGADVVYHAMKKVQQEQKDIILIVKRSRLVDPFMIPLRSLRMIEIGSWLSDYDLKAIYDVCDITVVPSRGGGFELNALESISTGTPTLATDFGCFKDYINYVIPIRYTGLVRIFNDNIVHIGKGANPDPVDLANKIIDTVDNLEYYNERFREYASEIRKIYTWQNVGNKLNTILKSVLK